MTIFWRDLTESVSKVLSGHQVVELLLQLCLITIMIAIAVLIGPKIEQILEPKVREIKNWPKMLRLLAVILRRTRWIAAAALLWILYGFGRLIPALNSADVVKLAAWLASAWVAIAIFSRIVRNRSAAKFIAIVGWSIVALAMFGLLSPVIDNLDSHAVTFGQMRLTGLALIKGIVFLFASLWLASLTGDFVERWAQRNSDLTPSFKVLLGKLSKVLFVTIAILLSVSATGVDLTTLTVFSGAIGLGLGFGLQKIVSNLVAGIIILTDKSIKPGDVIELGDTFGWIGNLRARFVSVVTRDGREYLIPNEDFITERVINWTFSNQQVRIDVKFGVSYDSDPHLIKRLAVEAANSVPRVQQSPPSVCHLVEFGDSSINFVLRFWIRDAINGLTNVRGDVLLACWDTFAQNDIKIPFPHREVILKSQGGWPPA